MKRLELFNDQTSVCIVDNCITCENGRYYELAPTEIGDRIASVVGALGFGIKQMQISAGPMELTGLDVSVGLRVY
jgi:hypothetical protein